MTRLFATTAASPPGTLRLLVTRLAPSAPRAAPALSHGGQALPVAVKRPWTPLRGAVPPGTKLTPGWSTLLEVPAPAPTARLRVALDADAVEVHAKAVPAALPAAGDSFNVLLVSCYHRDEDRGVAAAARDLAREDPVHLVLHLGDQVYLDLPTTEQLPKDPVALADALEAKYRDTFLPDDAASAQLRSLGPNVALPDDHEYWNNAPHVSYFLENTWRAADRARWWRLGHDLFTGYQGLAEGEGGLPMAHLQLDVEPLSFFFANTRSHRQADRSACLSPPTLSALTAWAQGLRARRHFGVLVTGQSLLDPKADALEGRVADYALPNYGDFPQMASAIDEVVRSAADVLLLTGDVHWGRVARLSPSSDVRGAASLYEVICSPAALCTTLGADTLKQLAAAVSGSADPWPRHAHAPVLERLVRLDGTKTPWWTETLHRQRGDMLCLLRFSRRGDGVEVRPRFAPVGHPRVDDVAPFTLRRR
ncbi:MAG: alkaline phosphatase D family protein [Myxococcaceae bacterium]|jgi:hypothetical protein|nr:alkaline phosphatase D family protein [Myxococcaceae bacterium]MCA3012527.1 alkaline phosphatase D family protein [Myxococcaceae bacterium]